MKFLINSYIQYYIYIYIYSILTLENFDRLLSFNQTCFISFLQYEACCVFSESMKCVLFCRCSFQSFTLRITSRYIFNHLSVTLNITFDKISQYFVQVTPYGSLSVKYSAIMLPNSLIHFVLLWCVCHSFHGILLFKSNIEQPSIIQTL